MYLVVSLHWFAPYSHFFKEIEEAWGLHYIGCFAIFHNRQLPRFNSRRWNPGSEAFGVLGGVPRARIVYQDSNW